MRIILQGNRHTIQKPNKTHLTPDTMQNMHYAYACYRFMSDKVAPLSMMRGMYNIMCVYI